MGEGCTQINVKMSTIRAGLTFYVFTFFFSHLCSTVPHLWLILVFFRVSAVHPFQSR